MQRLRRSLENDPKNAELRSTLDSIQEEIARQRAEQKRLERERAKEKAAAETLAKKAEADKKKSESARLGVAAGKAPKSQAAGSASAAADGRKRTMLVGAVAAGVLVVAGISYVVFHHPTNAPTRLVTAEVGFTISPADSTLTVDGNAESCPGKCVLKLTPGRHQVKLEKPEFIKNEIPVIVTAPSETNEPVNLALKPIPNPKNPAISHSSTLAILSHADAGSVTLDGNSSGSLPGSLDLGQLDPGTHRILVSEHGQMLTIQANVSDEGRLNVDGATGLNQLAVISVVQAGNEASIYCRCLGAEVEIDGKKPKAIGRDRYSFNTHGKAAFNLTVQPIGKFKPIPIYVADATHAAIHLEPFVQIADPADLIAWNNVKDSKDATRLKQFTSQFPASQYAKQANEEIDQLNKVQQGAQETQRQEAQQKAQEAQRAAEAQQKAQEAQRAAEAQQKALDAQRAQESQQKTLESQRAQEAQEAQQHDRKAVLDALETYRLAYERKDLKTLQGIWPSVPASLQQTLKAADKISVVLSQQQLVINGDTATVSSIQDVILVAGGKKFPTHLSRLFHLRRDGSKWIIEKDN